MWETIDGLSVYFSATILYLWGPLKSSEPLKHPSLGVPTIDHRQIGPVVPLGLVGQLLGYIHVSVDFLSEVGQGFAQVGLIVRPVQAV